MIVGGAANFRDIGGLSTVDGRTVRTGRLYRSGSLQDLTADDVHALVKTLGIRHVLDLRTAEEAVEQGRGLLGAQPVCYLNVPLVDVDSPAAPAGQIVLSQYLDHLDRDPNLPIALEVLAGALGHPTVLHCAAGKDRTGVVCALVELVIGVPAEQVVADYMVTAEHWDAVLASLRGWPRYAANMDRLPAEIYRCEEHVARGLVTAIEQRYGGAIRWARDHGVPQQVLDQLRDRLLE